MLLVLNFDVVMNSHVMLRYDVIKFEGHHLQGSSQRDTRVLPKWMRFNISVTGVTGRLKDHFKMLSNCFDQNLFCSGAEYCQLVKTCTYTNSSNKCKWGLHSYLCTSSSHVPINGLVCNPFYWYILWGQYLLLVHNCQPT